MAYEFAFGDVYNTDIGLKVEGIPDLGTAQRDGEYIPTPGKSRDDYIDYGRYKNVEFSLNVALVQKGSKTVREMIDDVVNAYAYLQGYQYFEDSEHFNLSTFAGLTNFGDFRREMRRVGKAVMKFTRDPFWYDVTGLQFTDVSMLPETPTKVLTNPFKLLSKPIIEIETTAGPPEVYQYSITDSDGNETVYNGYCFTSTATAIIDCETENTKVIDPYGTARFFDYTVPDGFKEGENTFKLLSGKSRISSIKIKPRWRCL